MARVKRGVTAHARHKKVLKLAKGYVGRSSTSYRPALERVEKAPSSPKLKVPGACPAAERGP